MNNIIEFKKDCILKTKVEEITDISLSHDYKILEDTIEGYFDVSGEYKLTKASLQKEEFTFTIPFIASLFLTIFPIKNAIVTLHIVNINEFTKKAFNSNIYYTTAKPDFIDGSIMENLQAINRNKNKIYDVCKRLDIYNDIKNLPHGFNSKIDSTLTRAQKFLIGLARALLSDCSTLLIYELPNSLTQHDKDKISSILWQLSKKRTIVLFTHTDEFRQIAKTTYLIEDGQVKDVDINDNSSFCLLQQFDVSLGNNIITTKDPTKN